MPLQLSSLKRGAGAGALSFMLNLIILALIVPLPEGFRLPIILQIAYWTFVGSMGAAIVLSAIRTRAQEPRRYFIGVALLVLLASFIPIYLRVGILHDFPPSIVPIVMRALFTMHMTDALIITASLLMVA